MVVVISIIITIIIIVRNRITFFALLQCATVTLSLEPKCLRTIANYLAFAK